EISHSFDDQGAQFDARGTLADWWTKEDRAHFEAAGAQLAAQYDAYRPFPDVHLNGKLTLGENIADLAGLAATHDPLLGAARRQPGAGGAGHARGAAAVPRLRAGVARRHPRAVAAPAHDRRRTLAVQVPRPHGAQSRCLVRGVRREVGAGDVPRPQGPRARV